MKGELSENELRYKAEAYCSSMERCVTDVEAKLSQWGATPEVMEKIVRYLQDERYIDQKRFCSAFVRDKYRFNQWGSSIARPNPWDNSGLIDRKSVV